MSNATFIVGVDAGKQTGIGILRRADDKVMGWCTKDFFTTQDFMVETFPNKSDVKVFVETPAKMLYGRNESGVNKQEQTIMYHAGGNRREAELLAGQLRKLGFTVEEVLPVREAKWDARRMKLFTGSNQRSNSHERDAVRLAKYYANK